MSDNQDDDNNEQQQQQQQTKENQSKRNIKLRLNRSQLKISPSTTTTTILNNKMMMMMDTIYGNGRWNFFYKQIGALFNFLKLISNCILD